MPSGVGWLAGRALSVSFAAARPASGRVQRVGIAAGEQHEDDRALDARGLGVLAHRLLGNAPLVPHPDLHAVRSGRRRVQPEVQVVPARHLAESPGPASRPSVHCPPRCGTRSGGRWPAASRRWRSSDSALAGRVPTRRSPGSASRYSPPTSISRPSSTSCLQQGRDALPQRRRAGRQVIDQQIGQRVGGRLHARRHDAFGRQLADQEDQRAQARDRSAPSACRRSARR